MSPLIQDFRYALRLLLKQPGFAAVVVGSLALGIGANTMIFSLVNTFLLRPLPYPDSKRMAALWFVPPNNPNGRNVATRRNCMALQERSQVFERVGCLQNNAGNVGSEGEGAVAPEWLQGQYMTTNLPLVLGINPVLGRWFTEAEEKSETLVALISYNQWQSRFGGSPDVLGKKLRIDSTTYTIIGVMPKDFQFVNNDANWWRAGALR